LAGLHGGPAPPRGIRGRHGGVPRRPVSQRARRSVRNRSVMRAGVAKAPSAAPVGRRAGRHCPALSSDARARTGLEASRGGPEGRERLEARVANRKVPRAPDGVVCCRQPPRRECGLQPPYAAYGHLSAPWWKPLRSLALQGRRVETREGIVTAVADATASGNHIGIRLWGAAVGDINHVAERARRAWRRCQTRHRLAGCTTQERFGHILGSMTEASGLGQPEPRRLGR
jgi:hypothetical protein